MDTTETTRNETARYLLEHDQLDIFVAPTTPGEENLGIKSTGSVAAVS